MPRPKPAAQPPSGQPNERLTAGLVCAVLALVTGLAFADVCGQDVEFLRLDDPIYVVDNPQVKAGLTAAGVRWALTTFEAGNWHPLTWLSLQLDHDIHGLSAGGFHLTNVLLHAANAVLLFLVLRRATGALWPSALVAGLFALHPLHVESVAWVTERKDVLSTLFWLLTMMAYFRYVERPGALRYAAVVAAFALGLMAKQMLVTLPFALLLLDYWPLRRLGVVPWRRLVLEKVPLLVLAAAASALTVRAQLAAEPLYANLPPLERLLNAGIAVVAYLQKTAWPADLAPMYTRPAGRLPVVGGVVALLAVLAVTAGVLYQGRRRPYLAVGWLWFLGTLVPVLGFIPVGFQTMADRYTYVPHIGLFVAIVWGLADALGRRVPRPALMAGGAVVLLACFLTTRNQAGLWRTNLGLWQHAVRVTEDNFGAHDNLGVALAEAGKTDAALEQFQAAVRIEPRFALGHYHLGQALEQRRQWAAAAAAFSTAIEISPRQAPFHHELGACLLRQGDAAAAADALTTAVQLDREPSSEAHCNLGIALLYAGRTADAAAAAAEADRLDPQNREAHKVLGFAAALAGRPAEAEAHFRTALWAAGPDARGWAGAAFHLAWSFHAQGRTDAARAEYRAAVGRGGRWLAETRKEAWRLATDPDAGKRNGPLAVLRAEIVSQALEGRDPAALDTLAAAYAEAGRFDDAVKTARAAWQLAPPDLAPQIDERLRLYEARRPYRAG